jgi:murein DD-endopeptidase MepM/ murein hydrolase activator NlpD
LQPTLPRATNQVRDRISHFYFFPPVRGLITNYFSPLKGHFGLDLVANPNEPIKATLEGSVLFANNSIETGNTIAIQHANNLVSIYKHLDVMLKKQGDKVETGEVIGIIGDTGILSSGPHLHFELWYQGEPVNPLDYIVF